MKKKGFTLIELLVVIAIIAMLMAILMPALSKVKKIAMRVVCGTNLKGLGTAQTVYANDYDDEYTVQGAGYDHTWSEKTDGWQLTETDSPWSSRNLISVGASLYLLVREADVSPKSFVCPASDQTEFDGKNDYNRDIVELYDFGVPGMGMGPTNCVSYAYHQPYSAGQSGATSTGGKGRHAADGTRSAAFAVAADKNPFFDTKLQQGTMTSETFRDFVALIDGTEGGDWDAIEKWRVQRANSQPHDREGQNVLYADGHTSYEDRGDVGVKNDYIYSMWSDATTEVGRRKGVKPANRDTDFAPQGTDDSVLVNDDLTID